MAVHNLLLLSYSGEVDSELSTLNGTDHKMKTSAQTTKPCYLLKSTIFPNNIKFSESKQFRRQRSKDKYSELSVVNNHEYRTALQVLSVCVFLFQIPKTKWSTIRIHIKSIFIYQLLVWGKNKGKEYWVCLKTKKQRNKKQTCKPKSINRENGWTLYHIHTTVMKNELLDATTWVNLKNTSNKPIYKKYIHQIQYTCQESIYMLCFNLFFM